MNAAPITSDTSENPREELAVRRAMFGLLALGALPMVAKSADAEQLDEEFLEYLAEFEDSDDDWSWFDSHADKDSRASQKQQPAARTTTEQEKAKP
jgi:hypothetical protein